MRNSKKESQQPPATAPIRRPTIGDVAQLAGVSRKTVSRVLNNEPYVTENKLKAVRNAIKTLKYVPSQSARRLAGRCSYALGVIYSPDSNVGSWLTDILQGIEVVSVQEGYEIHLLPSHLDQEGAQEQIAQRAVSGNVDGLIFLPPYGGKNAFMLRLKEHGVPLVQIEPPDLGLSVPTVCITNTAGAFAMTKHLIELGHRNIGFIAGSDYHRATEERLQGYKDALKLHSIAVDKKRIVTGDYTFTSGIEQGRRLLQLKNRPTAIFASNDEMAAGALQIAHQMGLAIPDDLAVAGFDDVSWAQKLYPPLTTIRQPMHKIARAAAELLIQQIKKDTKTGPQNREINTPLVVRASTKQPGNL